MPQQQRLQHTVPNSLRPQLWAVHHAARCSAPRSIPWNAQQPMMSWPILQLAAMLLHPALHEGLAIMLLYEGQALLLAHAPASHPCLLLVQAGLDPDLSIHCSPICTAQLANMLGLVAALIVFWICWPVIEWCIGTVTWLGS
jgi:hypothetical protein